MLAETGIDALSYAALHGDDRDRTRYAATSGALNPEQPDLIAAALHRLAEPRRFVVAADRDPDGERMAAQWTEIATRDGPEGLRIERAAPPAPGKDWNDALLASLG